VRLGLTVLPSAFLLTNRMNPYSVAICGCFTLDLVRAYQRGSVVSQSGYRLQPKKTPLREARSVILPVPQSGQGMFISSIIEVRVVLGTGTVVLSAGYEGQPKNTPYGPALRTILRPHRGQSGVLIRCPRREPIFFMRVAFLASRSSFRKRAATPLNSNTILVSSSFSNRVICSVVWLWRGY
jgi:hypothetical protein